MINVLEDNKFNELDFRLNVGLPLRHNREQKESLVITDLIIPLKKGILSVIPGNN